MNEASMPWSQDPFTWGGSIGIIINPSIGSLDHDYGAHQES